MDDVIKIESLTARIWNETPAEKSPFFQFLADRIMGRVQDEMPKYDSRPLRFEYGGENKDEQKCIVIHEVDTEAEDAARAEAAEARRQLQAYQEKYRVLQSRQ